MKSWTLVDAAQLLASSRSDGADLRLTLLGFLVKRPLSKVDAVRSTRVTRRCLDEVLRDWEKLGITEVRDASPTAKPRLTVYLKFRPVLRVTRIGGSVEEFETIEQLRRISRILASPIKMKILKALDGGEEREEDGRVGEAGKRGRGYTIRELTSKLSDVVGGGGVGISRQALSPHLKELRASGLVIVLRRRRETDGKYESLWRRNYEEMEFAFKSHKYASPPV